MPFEPGQLTRESERITKERLEQARVELAGEVAAIGDGDISVKRDRDHFEPRRRCPDCGAKLTVQVLPHGYEAVCTPCERRARFAEAENQ